jgi:RIO kinase 1
VSDLAVAHRHFAFALRAGGPAGAVMLKRDVFNITTCFSRFAPALAATRYGDEIWSLYESAELHPDAVLAGRFAASTRPADVAAVMQEIAAVSAEHEARLRYKALVRE